MSPSTSPAATGPRHPAHRLLALSVAFLALAPTGPSGCDDTSAGDDDTGGSGTASPPVIEHAPIADGQPTGTALDLSATVTDEEGVGSVTLFLRASGSEAWAARFFTEDEAQPGIWIATVDGADVTAAGVDYYIKATDIGSPRGEATAPEDAPESFYSFSTRVVGGGLPFLETFDGEGSLLARGWTHYNQGFPHYDWGITTDRAFSGEASAWHSDGISGLAGPLQDWLISPPLDFSQATDLSLSWYQLGLYTADLQKHAVLVSTGSAAPYDGEFALLTEDPGVPPEGGWGASSTWDLAAYAGFEAVYIAFYYESDYPSDRWFIDDVYVGPKVARFAVGTVTADPVDFGPGSTVDLTIEVQNVGDVDAPALDATLVSDDPLAEVVQGVATLAPIPSGSSQAPSPPFQVAIDPTHADNAWVDFTLTLTEGESAVSLPVRVLMGQTSTAEVVVDAAASGALHLRLGAGAPEAPAWETTTLASTATTWQVDLTEQASWLPPGAGDHRFFVEAVNDGLYQATVSSFTIMWGGSTVAATSLPVAVPPHGSAIVYLPDPPSFEVTAVETDPPSVAPGDAGVSLWLTVTNVGTATAGALSGTLSSVDEDATVVGSGPVVFSDAAVGAGEDGEAQAPFTVDVAGAHRDDSPIELELLLTDGVESFAVPVLVDVPYAHPQITATVVYDGFGGDGLIDRGDHVTLSATVTNLGALATQGAIEVTLSPAASSQVALDLGDGQDTFGAGPLGPGEGASTDEAFDFEVLDGYMGDTLVFDVLLTDGVDLWTQELRFELSARPWEAVAGSEDPSLDANAYAFDLARAWVRSDGEVLWIKVESHAPFDPATAFLDVHLYNSPSWWVLEYIYEEVRLRDDDLYGDVVEPSLPVQLQIDDTSISMRVLLDDLGIIGHSTGVAFASGICSVVWFCDIAPSTWFAFDLEAGTIGFYSDELLTIAW